MPRVFKRRGKAREATTDLITTLEEEFKVKEDELEALRKELKFLKSKLEEEE